MKNIKSFENYGVPNINEMGKTPEGMSVNSPAGTWTTGGEPNIPLMIVATLVARDLKDYPIGTKGVSSVKDNLYKEANRILTSLNLLNPSYNWERTIAQYVNFMTADDQDLSTLSKTQEDLWIACRSALAEAEKSLSLGRKSLNPYSRKTLSDQIEG